MKPVFRIVAVVKGHKIARIEHAKVMGDADFIAWSEEFAMWLQKKDPRMFDNLFLKSKFTFIQYTDVTYYNMLISEFAVPKIYLGKKSDGVGAFMIWAYFYRQRCGKTIWSWIDFFRERSRHHALAKQESYEWLSQNGFPDSILQWFNQKKAANTFKMRQP